MIDTIILDLDGPILDGRLRHYQCYSDILLERGFAPLPIDQYWEMKRNKMNRRLLLAASGADDTYYDEFLTSWIDRIEQDRYLVFDRVHPGVMEKLHAWKRDAIRLALITLRNNPATLHRQLELLGLLPLFDKIVSVNTSGDTARDKADAARSSVEKKTDSVLWIGDTEVDVRAARFLGVKACVVSCGLRTADYLATLEPDLIVPDLKAVDLSEMRIT